jgi:F0F1-type ATP synthase epsilon subunit
VTLLVDFGVHSDDLDEKLIMEAKTRAEKMLDEAKSENISKTAMADILHANLQLKFLPKIKKHRG